MDIKELNVLMVSLDRGLIDPKTGSGNVLERHKQYASFAKSLDIIVFGGTTALTHQHGNLTIYQTGVNGLRNIWRAYRIGTSVIRRKQVHLITTQDPHATAWVGLFLKKRFGVPLLVSFHGDFWNNPLWQRERWRNMLLSWGQHFIAPRADGIRVVSYGIRDKLIASSVKKEKIQVIHTPVNDRLFSILNVKQKADIEKLHTMYAGRDVLLFVGRFVPAKNLLFMLAVIEKLKKKKTQVLLLLIGDGELKSQLEQAIAERNLTAHVQMLGTKAHEELVPYYHIARAVLLLSTNESFGKVIIEAGLSGTPTLASDTTGARHIIQDGMTGFLVPINDLDATVGILEEMIDYPQLSKQLGERAQQLYRAQYSSERTTKDILRFWLSVAQK